MSIGPQSKMVAGIIMATCIILTSCVASLNTIDDDHNHESISSVIFDVYEDDGMTHFIFDEDYLFDMYLEESSMDLHGLGTFLSKNVTAGKIPRITDTAYCSAFTVGNDAGDGYLAGRNFDYRYSEPAIVHTSPDDGYDSVSMVDMTMFGDMGADAAARAEDTVYNALPYVPLDGVNEMGVFVCVNVVHNAQPILQTDPGESTIFFTSAIRLILDNAATTQEAVDLVMGINLHSDINYHLLVCDASGDSRAIEVVDNHTYATPTDIMTNHYITGMGKDTEISESSRERYDILDDSLDREDGMSEGAVKASLMSVQQTHPDRIHFTRWSVIYDLETLACVVWIVMPYDADGDMDYETPHRFSI